MEIQDSTGWTNAQLLPCPPCLPCSLDIAIHVKNGTAVISGIACSNEDIERAEEAVRSMVGIKRVFNLLMTE